MKRYERLSKTVNSNSANIQVSLRTVSGNADVHWHEYFEIEFIVAGNGTCTLNGTKYNIKKGDLFVLSPVDFHSINNDKSNPITLLNVSFDTDAVDNELLYEITKNKVNYLHIDDEQFDEMYTLFDLICKGNHKKPFENLYTEKMLCCILIEIIKCCNKEKDKPKKHHTPYLAQLASFYIQINFQNQITLSEIAEYAGTSATYLSEIFHRDMGVTIKAYITEIRLEYAKKMLIYSDKSVTDICYASGFNDFSTFSRAFKKRYEISPREYKKER